MSPTATRRLSKADRDLLASFALSPRQKVEVWAAWEESPEGVELCAIRARSEGRRNGNKGAGLLLAMIRRKDHLDAPDASEPRYTGYRWVRGTHSGHYVRDPHGTDLIMDGWQAPS